MHRFDEWFGLAIGPLSYPKSWFKESNRWKHFLGGMVLALFLTIFCAIGAAGGMEFKDVQWSGRWKTWDWLDFLATCFGGLVGQAIQVIFVVLLIFK